MEKDILQPTLESDKEFVNLKAYNINILFFLSLFGGLIPNVWYSVKNARWLKFKKAIVFRMLIIGMLLLIVELAMLGMLVKIGNFSTAFMVWFIFRWISFGLYAYYYWLMRTKYKLVKFFLKDVEITWITVILWIIIGIKVEFLIVLIVSLFV